MIKKVIKWDGSVEDFDPNKLNKWAEYACKEGGDWSSIALDVYKRLPDEVSSSEIHQTMLKVCYDRESIEYSRIAARLENATIRKNMERVLNVRPNTDTWKVIRESLINSGSWCETTLPPYTMEQESLYQEIKGIKLDAWQITQWADKYIVKINDIAVETPHIAAMGIGLGLLGDNWLGHHLVKYIIESKINLPTPILNGVRNGNFDGVSCCVISVGDSVASLAVGDHLAMVMTAKKAGIGYEATTRTKGSSVKNGAVKHLGKHPIYRSLDGSVKLLTQMTRGGSATVTFNAIDPEVEQIALWKSQRIDIEQRLDKLDYSFAFNDAFLEAVIKRKDWYLFDYGVAPEIYQAFYTASVEEYEALVDKYVAEGKSHSKVKALELLKHILMLRNETGRIYTFNVSRANEHTPFEEVIRLSNL